MLNKSSNCVFTVTGFGKSPRGALETAVGASFDPRPFAPGLSRAVELVLTPPKNIRGVFTGTLDVEISATGTPAPFLLRVPILYRIDSESEPAYLRTSESQRAVRRLS